MAISLAVTSEPKGILLLATLDTKGPEALYVRGKTEEEELKPILMDLSTRGKRNRSGVDIKI